MELLVAESIRGVEKEFYTASELETLTGIKANTWLYYGWAGKGPASLKVGRRRLWRRTVVETWLAKQEQAE
jgi:prophage regulatory protein